MSTLFDKIWSAHVVTSNASGQDLIYIDRHLLHEVSSPQAFSNLQEAGRSVRHTLKHLAIQDHNVPTTPDRLVQASHSPGAQQMALLRRNTQAFGIPLIDLDDPRQGIVHVVAPENGYVLPGSTVVCGDSHTATLGAFGAIAWGIGTSEAEHVMSTQSLWLTKPSTLGIEIQGLLPQGVFAKDLALSVIRRIGTSGGTGQAIEYFGEAVRALSMEGRLTLCNMTIEAGSRFGLIAPDHTTIAYLQSRVHGPARTHFDAAQAAWATLSTDHRSDYAACISIDASTLSPRLTWGTTPFDSVTFDEPIGNPQDIDNAIERQRLSSALQYMGLTAGQTASSIPVDVAFIGSCTNSRIEDLRAAAHVLKGRRVADGVRALVVPGSGAVKKQAQQEGLDRIFQAAGFEWREPGCSMCIGLNGDSIQPGQHCASTSNRNFENRQGPRGRTHLMSPAAVAASAIRGHMTDPREYV